MKNQVNVKVTEAGNSYAVTFHESKGLGFPFQLNLSPDVAEKVHQLHLQVMLFEHDLMNWMSLSNENAMLFLRDPVKALETSGINIPKEVIGNIKSTSDLLVNLLKK